MRLDLRLHDLEPRLRQLAVELHALQCLLVQPRRGFLFARQEEIAEDARSDHVAP